MKIKCSCVAFITLLGAQASLGEIINNGDMSSTTYTDRDHVEWQDVDQGWVLSDTNRWNLTAVPGTMSAPVGSASGFGQISSITPADTGNSLTFTFDWSPSGDINDADTLQYELIGWKLDDPGDLPAAVNDGFRAIQNGTFFVSGFNKKTEFVNLFNGDKYPDIADGGIQVPAQEITGVAGATTNLELVIDLSSFGAGYDTVSDYDLMGVRFHIKGQHASMSGSTVDNVSLVASGAVASNLPPVFTSDPIVMPQTAVDALFTNSVAGSATDPDGDPMTFFKVDGPDWLSVASNGFISGTPGMTDAGNNYFTVQVASVDGSNTTSLVVPVLGDDPAAAPGEMLLNWNMSTPTHGAITAAIQYQHIDAGWAAENPDVWSLTTEPGKMVMAGTSTGTIGDGLGQIVSTVGSGGSLNLKFDWTAGTNAVAVGSTNLKYQVIGWQMSTNTPQGGQVGFNNINGTSVNVSSFGTNDGVRVVDLLTGDAYLNTNNVPASQGIFSGTAGTNESADIIVNLNSFGAGFNNVTNYDYIGVRFHIGSTQPGGHGSIIDNVSLIASETGLTGGFADFVTFYGLDSDPEAHGDTDGLNNYGEYVFGGDPLDNMDIGTQPVFDAATGDYIFALVGDNTVVAHVVTTDDLVGGTWSTNETVNVSATDGVLGSYTNAAGTIESKQFIKLLID